MMRAGVLLCFAALMWAAALCRDGLDGWIARTELPPLSAEISPEVRARDGTLLRAYTVSDGRWRLRARLADVDPGYVRMLIAYEDKRFHAHSGVDPLALARAAYQLLRHGRIVSGGSTLTMQVARLLEDGSTGRWTGKIRQIRVALALERRLSKERILRLYLNRAPFGGNVEGVRAAARSWFGKPPRRLTTAEAALLVALPQSPETRRPDRFPAAALAARERVLRRMKAAGILDAEEVATAAREPVPAARRTFPALAPHLADRALATQPRRTVHDLTVDTGLQHSLERLARRAVSGRGDRLSIAMVVADHRSGEIIAHVGSPAYLADGRQGFVDMTRALRSPGSTLKPLIYGLAFHEGLAHPETLIDDTPAAFGAYMPRNFDGRFRGTVRLRSALEASLNIPAVRLLDALGPGTLMTALRRAGAEPALPGGRAGLAVALGGVGLRLEDLVTLYASFPQGGRARPLHWRRDGSGAARSAGRVLGPEAAWHVGDILSGIAPPRGSGPAGLAYKTGTSYGHRDAWAIGYDGRHVAGVWMGRADGTPVPGAFGGDLAAPILFDIFARLKPSLDPLGPPPPSTLIVPGAELPAPLRRFRPRDAAFGPERGGPEVAFPPDGALLDAGEALTVKVREGAAPFTWLVNGRPVRVATRERETRLPVEGPGFLHLSVIDAKGRAARADVTLR